MLSTRHCSVSLPSWNGRPSMSKPTRERPRGTKLPSKPVPIASHTDMPRRRGKALCISGDTRPIRACRCGVAHSRRGFENSLSFEDCV